MIYGNYRHKLDLDKKKKNGYRLPGETKGILIDWKRWYPVDQALMSYGYGISVSLFQMAHAYTIFTNNGCMLPVTFTKLDGSDKLPCTQIISQLPRDGALNFS